MVKKIAYISFSLLVACATWRVGETEKYRSLLEKKDFDSAQKFIDDSPLKKESRDQLLYLLESGTIAEESNQLDLAIEKFFTALELIDQLYTKKISQKIQSFIINDTKDIYYGSHFERSFVHYYLIKSYLKKYLQTSDKKSIERARSVVLAWDTYFNEVNRDTDFKSSYRTDLMLKVMGAQVHELIGSRNEEQIALQLYKDAFLMLTDEKVSTYMSDIRAFSDFLADQILFLTHKIRPSDLAQTEKRVGKTYSLIEKNRSHIFVIETGLVPLKKAKKFSIGLRGVSNLVEDEKAKKIILTVGAEVLAQFALENLGFGFNQPVAPGTYVVTRDALRGIAQELAIEFELSYIQASDLPGKIFLDLKSEKDSRSVPAFLVSSSGKLNQIVLDEEAGARYLKTGLRVLTHHLLAIGASYQIYKTVMKQTNDNAFLAKAAALTSYLAASKGLAFIERADLRQWMSLSSGFYIARSNSLKGDYQVLLSGNELLKLQILPEKPQISFIK